MYHQLALSDAAEHFTDLVLNFFLGHRHFFIVCISGKNIYLFS